MSRLNQDVPTPTWENFVALHSVGDVLPGRVTKVVPFGSFVEVAPGVMGLLVALTPTAVGSSVSVRINEIDTGKQRMSFSAVD